MSHYKNKHVSKGNLSEKKRKEKKKGVYVSQCLEKGALWEYQNQEAEHVSKLSDRHP